VSSNPPSAKKDNGLPEFSNPPVVEVAVGMQFEPLLQLRAIRLGRLRDTWRAEYPKYEEQPPLGGVLEGSPGGMLSLQLSTSPITFSRHWFLSEDGTRLIQLQHDRLVVNWRQLNTQSPYPRYSALRASFEASFTDLSEFVAVENIGEITPVQVEVTYINAIIPPSGQLWRLDEVISDGYQPRPGALGEPEQARLAVVYDIPGLGRPPVRMYLGVENGTKADGSPAIFLSLTARGAPSAPTFASVLDFADGARSHVARGFAELTTPTMHRIWGRQS